MIDRSKPVSRDVARQASPPSRRVLACWYGLMAAGGLGFGLIGERRPFGTGFFALPVVAYFIAAGVALLVLRVALLRPVPDVIPERALFLGCLAGLAAFLVGNFVSTYLLGR